MKDDLRQAFRALRRRPGFAAVAVLTLAFGIGINASLFSMISAFFLQPLPVKDAHQLVFLMQKGELINVPIGHSFPDYLDYRQATTVFSHLVAYMPTPVHLAATGETPERTWIEVVSPNYFALADVRAAVGDLLHPGQGESKGAEPTIVLSHRYWQRRFGGDPGIVGRVITLNGKAFTVVGVTPASFTGLSWAMAVSGFVPSGAMPVLMGGGDGLLTSRGAPAWRIMGRLLPGKTLTDARAEIEVVARRLAKDYPSEHKGTKAMLIPENRARPDPSAADFMPIFAVVFSGMVGLVLFIACANVANLMLSRSLVRQKDLALRSALGASRFRLLRLQVVESLLLAVLAGALALVFAHWSGQALAGFTPAGDIPVNPDHRWDWRIYAFTFLVSVVAGVGTGLWPAFKASRFELTEMLKEGGGRLGPSRHRLRNILVMGQVTMSLVVLICAGLFVHSLRQLSALSVGFRPDHLLMASIDLGLQQYSDERGRRFLDRLVERTKALPGVQSATLAVHVPFDYGIQINDVAIDGDIPGSKDGYLATAYSIVGHDFFETAGVALRQGRGLEPSDNEHSRKVAVANEIMARKLWPREDAVGKRFRFGRDGEWIEVVGVAAGGKYVMMAEEPRAYFYLPLDQQYRSPVTLMVRTTSDPAAFLRPLQDLLRELDPDLPVYNVRTMDRHLRESVFALMPFRMGATVAAFQGFIGLLLAVMGLYAVVSYAVNQRTHEIGVRMALGARRADVLWLVLREGMRLTIAGCVAGLLIALGVSFGLSHILYGVEAVNAGVIAGITGLLLAVSALACYLPARRATRVDPMVALRYE